MKFQATFNKFPSSASTIYAATIVPANGVEVLVFAKEGKANWSRLDDDTLLIVDTATTGEYDMLFNDGQFMDALRAYKDLESSGRIKIDDKLAGYKPDNSLELQGVSSSGNLEYRFAELNNGQVAILATCLCYHQQIGCDAAFDAIDRMTNMFRSI